MELTAITRTYQLAFITVVAASAVDANEDILALRPSPTPSIKVPLWAPSGELGTSWLRPEGWYADWEELINIRT